MSTPEQAESEAAEAATAIPGPAGGPATDLEQRIKEISDATGQDPDVVRAILTAIDSQAGEAVGVVRRNPNTGAIAHRVKDGDIVKWRISHPTDGMSYEMTPTKSDWQLVES